jgi:hypothetical protein
MQNACHDQAETGGNSLQLSRVCVAESVVVNILNRAAKSRILDLIWTCAPYTTITLYRL